MREQALINCTDYFPNVTELTLSNSFQEDHCSLSNDLNRVLPLIQLTKLNINSEHFCFTELIELLCFTPNIHTMKIASIRFYSRPSKAYETYNNSIRNVTVDKLCTLKEIKLLVHFCSRIECLTINIHVKDFDPIIPFLLTKNNPETRHLFLLCLTNVTNLLSVKILERLIQYRHLLDDYSIELIHSKIYLWW